MTDLPAHSTTNEPAPRPELVLPTAAAEPARALTRRRLLALGAGGVVALAGCGRPTPAADPPPTIASLVSSTPFFVAHRGGGGDWPEMTAYAYQQASLVPGLKAMEISVCLSRDSVLVCSHDPTTIRTTGVDLTIAEQDWSALSGLMVSAKDTVDPGQPARPLARFDEVVERWVDRFVLFVEPKTAPAQAALLARLQQLGNRDRLVWKQPVTEDGFAAAKAAGFGTWGYVLDAAAASTALGADASLDDVDMLGFPVGGSTSLVAKITSAATDRRKPTIAWPIVTDPERSRALAAGATGLMTSRIRELPPPVPAPS